jgi:DNA-binding response OmpR family regulator
MVNPVTSTFLSMMADKVRQGLDRKSSVGMKTILLVDDDLQLRSLFSLALRNSGFYVVEANSGAAGLEMARLHSPDLILSDIQMPGGDGSTLLKDIRRDPNLKSRHVVLMTGRADLVASGKAMELGADEFLLKPFSLQSLLSCVNSLFKRASSDSVNGTPETATMQF